MKYTLTFSEEELMILDKALQEVPFKYAAPIVRSINDQIIEQTRQTEEKEDDVL